MKTVIGAFDTFGEARAAVDSLERAGFNDRDVSIVANNANNTIGTTDTTTTTTETHHSVGGETLKGAAVGGLAGLIVGLAPFVIPGLGAIAAAGWLTMTLTGAAIGAGVGLVGALMGVGVPEEEAHYYNESVRRGGTLVLVRADDIRAEEAARILSDAGAIDIDERAATYRNEGWMPDRVNAATATPAFATGAATVALNNGPATTAAWNKTNAAATTVDANAKETRIPVIEEQVKIGKQQVQRGGVRVYTHVTEKPVQEQVNLREEHVHVERRPVDQAIGNADINNLREGTIEVRETAEIPVVEKQARVVEEVVINKEVTQNTQTVGGTARRTDVQVEQIPGTTRTTTGVTGATGVAGADTRGPLERAEDFVTGDNIDDKTGEPIKADTRGAGEKVADAITGDRVDDKTGRVVR